MTHQQRSRPGPTLLQPMHQLTRSLLHTSRTPLPDSKYVIKYHRHPNIEENVRKPNPVVSPSRVPLNTDGSEELIRDTKLAVLALGARRRVDESAPWLCGEKVGEIGAAGLVGRRVEAGEFVGGADDGTSMYACGGNAGDEVGEWRDSVHEDPKAGEGGGWLHHPYMRKNQISPFLLEYEQVNRLTIKRQGQGEQEGSYVTCCLCVG